MIVDKIINKKKCVVAFIDDNFEPCDEADATAMKVIYEDGSIEFRAVGDEQTDQMDEGGTPDTAKVEPTPRRPSEKVI